MRASESWLREVQRDLMALGSVVFYLLVLGRALVGPYWDLATPLLLYRHRQARAPSSSTRPDPDRDRDQERDQDPSD